MFCWWLLLVVCQAVPGEGFCPEDCTCNDVALSVSCENAGLEVLPITLNPSIQRLHLQNNKIKAVDAALGFYGQLHHVDLSYNELLSVPDRAFKSQRRLVELRLLSNKISKLSNATFDGLKSLRILSLRKNFLEELAADGLFAQADQLEELDIGQNRIRTVQAAAFAGLAHLRILYLDDNDLHAVPSQAFGLIPHLAELHLGLNPFEHIPEEAFRPIANLYLLDLHGGSVHNISAGGFHGLETLRVLRLSGNALDAVPSRQLEGLERLEELSLGRNYIETIGKADFAGLRKLRLLDVSHSRNLAALSAAAFPDTSALSWLSLTGCRELVTQLAAADTSPLAGLTGLRTVHMADMGWRTVPRGLLAWPGLEVVDLGQNPLRCDCDAGWLQQLLLRTERNGSSNSLGGPRGGGGGSGGGAATLATCAEPASLAGQSLTTVSPSALECSSEDGGGGGGGDGGSYGGHPEQAVLAAVCVAAGLATGLSVLAVVHCHRKAWRLELCRPRCEACQQFPQIQEEVEHGNTLYYAATPGLQNLDLYYPSSTKSTYCDDDYFLSLSKDKKTFKPIRVCEL